MSPAAKNRWDVILQWAAQQGPSTVLLFAIFVGGFYSVREIVPAHLKQIQEGYERIEKHQSEQIHDITETHARDMDRMERWLTGEKPNPTRPFAVTQ